MGIGVERVQAKIKAEVARILRNEIKDPRMGSFVTVIDVQLTNDYKYAKILISVMAERDAQVRTVMRMLKDATAFVQHKVAGRLRTRVTPTLEFILDEGAQKSVKIGSILEELKRERDERGVERGVEEPAEAEANADGDTDTKK
jgi:ribosome-binding factor A